MSTSSTAGRGRGVRLSRGESEQQAEKRGLSSQDDGDIDGSTRFLDL